MAFWNKSSADERLVRALERLVQLKEIELAAKGLTLYTSNEVGEAYETDFDLIAKREYEDGIRKRLGLAPNQPIGVIDPETGKEWSTPVQVEESFFSPGPGFGFGVGPEGAESLESGAEEARHE
jgi:hypothetical protein